MNRNQKNLLRQHFQKIHQESIRLRETLSSLIIRKNEDKLLDFVSEYVGSLASVCLPEVKGQLLIDKRISWPSLETPVGPGSVCYPYLLQSCLALGDNKSKALQIQHLISRKHWQVDRDVPWGFERGSIWLAVHNLTKHDIAAIEENGGLRLLDLHTGHTLKTISSQLFGYRPPQYGMTLSEHSIYWFACVEHHSVVVVILKLHLNPCTSAADVKLSTIPLDEGMTADVTVTSSLHLCLMESDPQEQEEGEDQPHTTKSEYKLWIWKLSDDWENHNDKFVKSNAIILRFPRPTLTLWMEGNFVYRRSRTVKGNYVLDTYLCNEFLAGNLLIRRKIDIHNGLVMITSGLCFLYYEGIHQLRILV